MSIFFRISLVLGLGIGLVLLPVAGPTRAGVLDFFGVPSDLEKIRNRTLSKLLEDFQSRAEALILEGENTGNALLVQAGNEAILAIGGAEIVFGRNLTQTLNALDNQQEEIFARVDAALTRVEKIKTDFVTLSDALSLDIEQLVSQLPFTDVADLYVRRVEGLVVPPKSGPLGHVIRVTGSKFGVQNPNSSISIRLEVEGVDQGIESYSSGEPHVSELVLTQSWVDNYKDSKDLNILPVTIRATRTTKNTGFWAFFSSDTTSSTSLELRLVVLPEVAGRIRPVYSETPKVWIPNLAKGSTVSVIPGKTVPISEAPGVVGGVPKLGDIRFISGSARASCKRDVRDAFSFPKKTVPATDRIFRDGWSKFKARKSCVLPLGHPFISNFNSVGHDSTLSIASTQAKLFAKEFGVSRKTVFRWLRNRKENPSLKCWIPASQLKKWGTEKKHDFSACPDVWLVSSEPGPERTTVMFRFGGSGKREATYDISAQFERYGYNPEGSVLETMGPWVDLAYGTNELSLRAANQIATKFEFQPSWSPTHQVFLDTQMDSQEGFSSSADTSQGGTRLFLFSYQFPL